MCIRTSSSTTSMKSFSIMVSIKAHAGTSVQQYNIVSSIFLGLYLYTLAFSCYILGFFLMLALNHYKINIKCYLFTHLTKQDWDGPHHDLGTALEEGDVCNIATPHRGGYDIIASDHMIKRLRKLMIGNTYSQRKLFNKRYKYTKFNIQSSLVSSNLDNYMFCTLAKIHPPFLQYVCTNLVQVGSPPSP